MSNTVTFKHDFSNIINYFDKMGKDIDKVEKAATMAAAKIVSDEMKNNLNYSEKDSSGYKHIKDNIFISSLKENEDGDTVRHISGGRLHYKWKFLEFGTVHMQPNHFITASLKYTQDDVKKVIDSALKIQFNL